MKRRNWLDLSRKLIDRFDMDDCDDFLSDEFAAQVIKRFPMGILPNADHPSPFQTTLSGANMTGTVTAGTCWDASGQKIEVDSTQNFTLASDPTNPRKAYLVVRFAQTGETSIPKPSDPLNSVFLNLTDTFTLEVLLGTPAGSPAYPSAGANDVILMGFTIPAAATLAFNCTEDATVRHQGVSTSTAIKTANYTITPFDKFVPFNANSGALVATLPKGKFSEGAEVLIAKTDSSSNAVTYQVDGTTTDTLVWGTTLGTLDSQGASIRLRCKAGVWYQAN